MHEGPCMRRMHEGPVAGNILWRFGIMVRFYNLALAALAAAALPAGPARAEAPKGTVCTITVNSANEKEVFRRFLPEDRYDFVELVERGRPDWLAQSCRRDVQC